MEIQNLKLVTLGLFIGLAATNVKTLAEDNTYRNPVINVNAPDPTVIRHSDGTYYLYATESKHKLPIYKIKNSHL